MEWLQERKAAIVRGIVLALGLINGVLQLMGKNPLPVSDEQVMNLLSSAWIILASLWSYWKNNSFTDAAIEGDKVMKQLKSESQEDDPDDLQTLEISDDDILDDEISEDEPEVDLSFESGVTPDEMLATK